MLIEWCGKLQRLRDRTELCKLSNLATVCLCSPGVDGSGISNYSGNDKSKRKLLGFYTVLGLSSNINYRLNLTPHSFDRDVFH
jgi:hypothetical protein